MNFKISLMLLAFIICSCGVQGKPSAKNPKNFKSFEKIYEKNFEIKKDKIDKKDKNKK